MKKKIDVIWNITRMCMWDCAVCCVDALYVKKNKDKIDIFSKGLTEKIQVDISSGNIFEDALDDLIKRNIELPLEKKFRVIDNLSDYDAKIDFSGGDPFSTTSTLEVIKYASNKLGKHNITVTATGAGLQKVDPEFIQKYIGEVNFTMDHMELDGNDYRPKGYAVGNLKRAAKLAKLGVDTRGETPLTKTNIDPKILEEIYLTLHRSGVKKHLIMRLFPVGRGEMMESDIPSPEQYRTAITHLKKLERQYKYPVVKLQCALKFFDEEAVFEKNPCDAVVESFGLLPDGRLLGSPWAIDRKGEPFSDFWVLGNLAQQPMAEIMRNQVADDFTKKQNQNFGHCKIYSYLYGVGSENERTFSKTDPLYISNQRNMKFEREKGRHIDIIKLSA